MANPADNVVQSGTGINKDSSAVDNHKARGALNDAVARLQWNASILDDKVKDDKGVEIKGKYKIQVQGIDDELFAYITQPDVIFKKGEPVMVNIDSNMDCWIISPAFPRGSGFGLCMCIIDDLIPGTWGVSLPRFGSGITPSF